MIALTERFLREIRAKHAIDDAEFLVDGTPWLQAALHRYNLDFSMLPTEIEMLSNESSKK